MADSDDDPRVVRSIAVTADDVVSALEHNRSKSRHAVLRITPPFNGRMRARLHVESTEDRDDAVHFDPDALVAADRPSYPRPEETEDRVRAEGEYSTERHYDVHVEAVRAWREATKDAIVDAVEVETDRGPHRVEVKRLG